MNNWEKIEVSVGYRQNEWVAMFIDCNGNKQIETFNTMQDAEDFMHYTSDCRIGIVTTSFYNNVICK